MKKTLITSVIIGGLIYLTTLCATPEYKGLRLKAYREFASVIGWHTLVGLLITIYVIAIAKEFMYHKLWNNYKKGLWCSIKTTFLLLTSPILSISLIYNYKE